ncbi:MAG: hypothetical protein HYX89_06470 [Chloroflexi bacterium]|nr:hypothetical protein [Chloroflexota bacterium]
MDRLKNLLDGKLRLDPDGGPDKRTSLSEAVQRLVKPGMLIHLALINTRWCTAAVFELARQFWGKDPGFTLACLSMSGPFMVPVYGKLVKKIITAYSGDPYYNPGPNRVYQEAYRQGTAEFENWSILTYTLRLMAGAMGVSALPTRSLIGSGMAQENTDSFTMIDDPFQHGEKLALVKAMVPDLAIAHAMAADRQGNALFVTPSVESIYGAIASRNGTIVTAERIVPTEFIRRYSHLPVLPGRYVAAVCEAPFGAHPAGMPPYTTADFEGYAEDYDFVEEIHNVSKDQAKLEAWVKEWVLEPNDRSEYVQKLGAQRVLALKGKVRRDSWRYELEANPSRVFRDASPHPAELAIVAASRKMKEIVRKKGYRAILAGAGIANLAAWLAYYDLREEGHAPDLMAEVGMYGYTPRPADPGVFNFRNHPTCTALTDSFHVLGIYASGANNRCLGALGVGEVDKYGDINSTKIPGRSYIIGSGGANDVASSAEEVVIVAVQAPRRFVDQVAYITSPGTHASTLVSDLGVYEKIGGGDEFILTAYFPRPGLSTIEEHVRHIKGLCGWDLKVAPNLEVISPPTAEELQIVRAFDLYGYFLGE